MLSDVNKRLASYQPLSTSDKSVVVLKAFTQYLPRDGMRNICDDILDRSSDEELRELATHLTTALLAPMKATGKTPVSPSPRFGVDDSIEEIISELVSSSREQGWLKEACLRRDDNRCVLSGLYDTRKAKESLSEDERKRTATTFTQAAHIIPFSVGNFAPTELGNTAMIWDALYRYFPGIRSRLNFSADKINDTYNAITLADTLHSAFGAFQFALEPTSEENAYRIKQYTQFPTAYNQYFPEDGTITFLAHSQHSLPSATLLEAHAAIAKILQETGMGEYIDSIFRERQLIHCLAPDGSTNVQSLLMVF